ncbi:MAG: BrnT family toxin [Sandaracinaceae bacterium]|nr:BrnT family toxin [Sandaracinaceae bacterium]
MRFEWDAEKASRNERVHGVSFEEAKELFTTEADVLEIYDVEHSLAEDRFKSIGPISRGLVLVVWTERLDDVIRIISARWATAGEARAYRSFVEELHGER